MVGQESSGRITESSAYRHGVRPRRELFGQQSLQPAWIDVSILDDLLYWYLLPRHSAAQACV